MSNKDSILDVLLYLFESRMDGTGEFPSEAAITKQLLEDSGFSSQRVHDALVWLEQLEASRRGRAVPVSAQTIRVYTRTECRVLSTECRGYLAELEQLGILSMATRETVIDRLLALEDEIDLERLRWVVLMVLAQEPDAELSYERMEELVCDPAQSVLH